MCSFFDCSFFQNIKVQTWGLAVCKLSAVSNCQASDHRSKPFAPQVIAGSKGTSYGLSISQVAYYIDIGACEDAVRARTKHQAFAVKQSQTPFYLTGFVFWGQTMGALELLLFLVCVLTLAAREALSWFFRQMTKHAEAVGQKMVPVDTKACQTDLRGELAEPSSRVPPQVFVTTSGNRFHTHRCEHIKNKTHVNTLLPCASCMRREVLSFHGMWGCAWIDFFWKPARLQTFLDVSLPYAHSSCLTCFYLPMPIQLDGIWKCVDRNLSDDHPDV